LTLKGFYAPVDMGNSVVNTAKGGSTVPLKFEVFATPRATLCSRLRGPRIRRVAAEA
jgi:hypothetical protein